ncbi:MAG: GIY-YIG nuclease family protein [Candidatus Aenigmatarchaeota archaeon]
MSTGAYSLFIKLEKDKMIKIGKLGKFVFPKGFYVYTGSALKNLEARIERHFKKRKKKFWHVDYLLQGEDVKIMYVVKVITKLKIECELNRTLSKILKAYPIIKKFGSSDCKCESHLLYSTKPIENLNFIDELVEELNRLSFDIS